MSIYNFKTLAYILFLRDPADKVKILSTGKGHNGISENLISSQHYIGFQ